MAALGSKLRTLQGGLLAFWCPGCDSVHHVNSGWTFNGDGDKPTFSPSVLVNAGRANPQAEICHSFVRDGRIEFLGDCTHALAGKTVDLPDFDPASPYAD